MSWFKHWFSDEVYIEVYARRDAAEAREAVSLFESVCRIPSGSRILDLACGTGRHAYELSRRGYEVIAADLSAMLLALAVRKTQRLEIPPRCVRTDMRKLPFVESLDAVVQLFTAFGYFISDQENASVFHQVAASMKQRGWYMLDYLNAEEVVQALVAYSEERIESGYLVQERRIIGNRVEKTITIVEDKQVRTYTESVRLFTASELQSMMEQAGFSVSQIFGTYSGETFSRHSPRCIIFAQKL